MLLGFLIPPAVVRIVLPALLLAGYAGYHYWRWRMLHPRIDFAGMPDPAESAGAMPPIAEAPPIENRTLSPEQSARLENWRERRARQEAQAEVALEAYDPDRIAEVHRQARARRPELFVRLGEYAWCRGAMVEAHFWVSLAKFHGVEGLDDWLDRIHKRWLLLHRPSELQNAYAQFTPQHGALSRAHLLYLSGFNVQLQYDIIMRMAQKGDRDARLFLENIDRQKRTATYVS